MQPGIDFINCFTPYAYLWHLERTFAPVKFEKLFTGAKVCAQGAKVRCRVKNSFLKLTPGTFHFVLVAVSNPLN